jgi:pseudouridine synthase
MPLMRINRALALAGAASRRGAEELVAAGRVKLNGQVVTSLGTQVNTERDELLLDGRKLRFAAPVYYLYHKPRGVLSTMQDEQGRECVGTVARALPGSPVPVGRLDRASEGLMLLTNDGQVALRLAHPRYRVRKEYQVTVSPRLADRDAQLMVGGVTLEDGSARFTGIELQGEETDRSRLLITVEEGRNRLIRRVCEALGYRVLRLKRLRLGIVALGKLPQGETRQMGAAEAENLRQSLGLGKPAAASSQRRPGGKPVHGAARRGSSGGRARGTPPRG